MKKAARRGNAARPLGPEVRSEHDVARHQGAVHPDEDLEIRPAVAVGVAGQDAAGEAQLARDVVEGLVAEDPGIRIAMMIPSAIG